MQIDQFMIFHHETVLNALTKIDQNRKGFLVVVDQELTVVGTLTDGDIRRAFIAGHPVQAPISECFNQTFAKIDENDDIGISVELFKNGKIKFLPILDGHGHLINIITRNNLQTLLLEDRPFDCHYDFLNMDDTVIDHEIYNRPWGYYKTTFINPFAQSKIMKINPRAKLSLQAHNHREEYWVVIVGQGEVTIGESVKKVEAGSFIFIPRGCKHRVINTTNETSLMIAEVQLGDYFGEDDIIRFEDIYGRTVIGTVNQEQS
ncbi:MAG: cupin domain-containing protein [Eubacteriales bacterium]|nr:cupin domain-containing protein [Eubacteriales bacterium]